MSLKAIAHETLARLRAGETGHETEEETRMKQAQQPETRFIQPDACFTPMKHEKPQISANKSSCFTVSFPMHETHETKPLPGDIIAGLAKLQRMRAPKIKRPELWAAIVRDGLQIGTHWASQAIGLGWEPLHLFGVEPSPDPDPWDHSLAVVLAGRSIRAVDEQRFYLREGDIRSLFERRARPALSCFLWELF